MSLHVVTYMDRIEIKLGGEATFNSIKFNYTLK